MARLLSGHFGKLVYIHYNSIFLKQAKLGLPRHAWESVIEYIESLAPIEVLAEEGLDLLCLWGKNRVDCRTIKVQPKDTCGKNIKNESLDRKGERKREVEKRQEKQEKGKREKGRGKKWHTR